MQLRANAGCCRATGERSTAAVTRPFRAGVHRFSVQVYLMNGGVLGRPTGTSEGEKRFLEKPLTKQIIGKIQEKRSVIEISKYLDCSSTTVVKTRKIAKKYGLVD